jgi:hypothetical protein
LRRQPRLLFNHFWNEIEPAFDARRNGLEKLVLIVFGDHIFAQTQDNVLCVSHWFDPAHIDGSHLFDHSEDAPELLERGIGFRIVDGDSGEAGRTQHIVSGESHKTVESLVKTEAA